MMINLKRLLPGRKSENDGEAPAENPKKSKKKLLIGILAGVVVAGVGGYVFLPYLFPATEGYSAVPEKFSNNPSELFGPPAGAESPLASSPPPDGGELGGLSGDHPEAPIETLGVVASGEPQSLDAGAPAGPIARPEGPSVTAPEPGMAEEPSPDPVTVAAGQAVKMGRKIYDLQYELELKRLQLELAKLDAEIAEQSAKTLPPPLVGKNEDSEADAPELPKPELAPSMMSMLPAGGQEKKSGGLAAITEDKAIIDGKLVRVGGVYNGMKVIAVDPRLGLVKLRSPIGGVELEMSM